jgi:hypothetical protein
MLLGSGEEYVLIDLTKTLPQDVVDAAKQRDYLFAGVIAMVDGRAVAKRNPNLTVEAGAEASEVMLLATATFARRVAERIRRERGGDFAQFVTTLMELPDTRANKIGGE